MADRFQSNPLGKLAPLTTPERSTHAAADFTPANTTRAIFCDADGTLTVDTSGGALNKAILVGKGWNPIEITKIYQTGSDAALIVDCWD